MQAEVDFSVRAKGGDVALECLAGLEVLEDFICKNQPAVSAVDDRFVAQIRFSENDEIDFLFEIEVGWCAVHVAGDACGGDEAPGVLVDEDVNDVVLADIHADFLLAKGDEEVLW